MKFRFVNRCNAYLIPADDIIASLFIFEFSTAFEAKIKLAFLLVM